MRRALVCRVRGVSVMSGNAARAMPLSPACLKCNPHRPLSHLTFGWMVFIVFGWMVFIVFGWVVFIVFGWMVFIAFGWMVFLLLLALMVSSFAVTNVVVTWINWRLPTNKTAPSSPPLFNFVVYAFQSPRIRHSLHSYQKCFFLWSSTSPTISHHHIFRTTLLFYVRSMLSYLSR